MSAKDKSKEATPPPSAYAVAEVESLVERSIEALSAAGTAMGAVAEKLHVYREVADRSADLVSAHAVLQRDVETLEAEIRERRAGHEQEMAEWAQQRAAELRAHADGLEQRRVKMEEDLQKKQIERDNAHAKREAKLGEAEKIAAARVAELQDEIRVLQRRQADLQQSVNDLEALKSSTRDELAAIRAKIG